MIPVCQLIWLPDGHLKNHDFPFTKRCISVAPYPNPPHPAASAPTPPYSYPYATPAPIHEYSYLAISSYPGLPSFVGYGGVAEGRVG